jgi:predicted secreted Zn-dependent protease
MGLLSVSNKSKAALAATLLLSACITTDSKVTTRFYDVKGTTPAALDAQLRSLGPLNGHALALAEIQFEPVKATLVEDATGCRSKEIDIRVNARITLPRWMNRTGADSDLRRAFNNLEDYAKAHEQMHVTIAEAAAKSMERRIAAIPTQRNCKAFEREVAKVVRDVSKVHNRLQNEFDASEQRRLRKLFAENRARS